MNSKLFDATMVLHGDTQRTLSGYLGITQSCLSNKKNGKSEFTQTEIAAIRKRWELTAAQMDDIFFCG